MQPPRGRRAELAWACVVLTFTASAIIDWPWRFLALRYPTWLRWIDYTFTIIFLATLASFLVLRGREIANHRRQQADH